MIAVAHKRSNELATGFAGGTPLAVVIVWGLNAFVLPAPMPPEISVAVVTMEPTATTAATLVARVLNRRM